jgi:hypothetical protein
MFKRIRNPIAVIGALGALALGGAALAGATQGQGSVPPQAQAQGHATESQSEPAGTADTDSVQAGDQTGPDNGSAAASESGTEAAGESGSEVPGDDGPGGHADEPGNPNADHQFQGEE